MNARGLLFAAAACVAACGKGGSAERPDAAGDAGSADVAVADTAADTSVETIVRIDAPPVLNIAWDWAGIVGTGQSLSVGHQGIPVIATKQVYGNLKIALGALDTSTFAPLTADPASSELSMVPLVEPIRPLQVDYPSAYPRNIFGETPHTAMAGEISLLARQAAAKKDYITVHTVVGESGREMALIRKGAVEDDTGGHTRGRAYAASMFEVKAIARLAAAAGKTYGIGAVIITHGEADADRPEYGSELVQMWSDYNDDLRLLTGQKTKVPMLVSQQNTCPLNTGVSVSAAGQWKAGVDHPGDIIVIGPKYQYPYFPDNLHLHAHEYDLLGEKFGQVYFERVVAGRDWQPLQPVSIERSGPSVLLVHFHVPVAPLVWDNNLPRPHTMVMTKWAQGRGFEVTAAGVAATIKTAEIVGGDAVKITCQENLTGRAVLVGYAMTADGELRPGGTYRWGQLRDSDPFVGAATAVAQANYAVAFEMSVP